MQNPSTPPTPGGTTEQPYTDELVYDHYVLTGAWKYPALSINPGGWLCAIMVRKLGFCDDMKFELTGGDQVLYAGFTVWAQMNCGGVTFDPVPNVSSKDVYWLSVPEARCELEVISVNRMLRHG